MYLKTLTLKGFKSFANPVHLSLEPGVTCVVGPNGSGKSNVVDALAWVMGEQGAKNLRGGQMSDVIFAGTKTKAALGRAEVQLTIDNSDGALPIDYTEVTISRTMFRAGGSEYAINGSPVRLLDIQELLSDTGMGRQMHVIVGQGQLDTILSASELERRAFIEEAAGVLKHRQRKDRALRKLDSLAVNLSRVQDLTNDVGKRLGPLGKQAQAARKAARVQAELEDASARLLADSVVTQQEKLQSQTASKEEILAAIAKLDEDIAALRSKQAAAKSSLEEVSPGLESLTQVWSKLGGVSAALESLSKQAQERLNSLEEAQADAPADDTSELEQRLERNDQEIQVKTQEVAQLQQDLEAAVSAEAKAKNAENQVREKLENLRRAAADKREKIERLRGAVATAASLAQESQSSIERLSQSLQAAQEREAVATKELSELEQTLPGSDTDNDLLQRENHLAQELAEAKAKLEELQAAFSEARTEAARWEARRSVLEKTLKPADAAAAVLDAKLSGISGVLSELITVDTGWEEAIGAVFGPWSGALLSNSVEVAADAVRYAREHQAGQVHLLISASNLASPETDPHPETLPPGCHRAADLVKARKGKKLPQIVVELLDGVVACEELSQARQIVGEGRVRLAVTQAGDSLSATQVIGGGDSGAQALRLQAEYDDAADAAESAGQAAQDAETQLLAARQHLEDVTARLQEATAQLQRANARAAEVATALAGAKARQVSAQAETQRMAAELEQARKEAGQRSEKLAQAKAELEQVDAVVEAEPGETPDLQEELTQALETVTRAQDRRTEAQIAAKLAAENLESLHARAESLKRNIAAHKAAALAAQQRARKRERRRIRAQHVYEQAQAALLCARQAVAQASAQRETLTANREELNLHLETLRAALDDLHKQRNDRNESSLRDQVAIAQMTARLDQLLQSAREEHGLDAESLVAKFGPHNQVPVFNEDGEAVEWVAFVRTEQVEREAKAKEELKRIGKVNPLALAEHESLKARHQFLSDQLADLKKSRADLLDVVEQVDAQVKEVFGAAFKDVAGSFQEIFQVLFPGGEGKLELTDPKDLLHTGIDIQVRPAGKNVKRMSLLSGGERSLAALAFLFAIFMARPSPFYVLDEVEAALDDMNLSRLLGVFEILRRNSQLIIITHHKRTMEIADALYGVTMREGTTTVISQRLAHPRLDETTE